MRIMILEDSSSYSVDIGLEHNLKGECNSSVRKKGGEENVGHNYTLGYDNDFLCYLFQRTIIFKMA